jgi:hypothetical protein
MFERFRKRFSSSRRFQSGICHRKPTARPIIPAASILLSVVVSSEPACPSPSSLTRSTALRWPGKHVSSDLPKVPFTESRPTAQRTTGPIYPVPVKPRSPSYKDVPRFDENAVAGQITKMVKRPLRKYRALKKTIDMLMHLPALGLCCSSIATRREMCTHNIVKLGSAMSKGFGTMVPIVIS